MMRSMLVIGLGRFGTNLSLKLMELDNEVMVIDRREAPVNHIAPYVTRAQIGDCMDERVLKSLGVSNFDVCFVCTGEEFQSSLEITSLLRDMGAKRIIAKADRDIHQKLLLRLGADEVVNPERDMALRAAVRYSAKNAFDYIDISSDYAISEIAVPEFWTGKTIGELEVRARHRLNIIGYREGEHFLPVTRADHVFTPGQRILAAGSKKDLKKLME